MSEVNLEEMEQNLQAIVNEGEPAEETKEETKEETEVIAFDLDAALDKADPFDLEKEIKAGRYTEEEAKDKATERGWNEGSGDKYGHKLSAIEFLERTPFFKKFDRMHEDQEHLKHQMNKLVEQNKKIAEKSLKDKAKMREDFKKEREELLNTDYLDGDAINRVKKLDKQIDEVEVQAEESEFSDEDRAMSNAYNEAKIEFKKNNEWYESDDKMTSLADEVGTSYASMYFEQNGKLPDPEYTFRYTLNEVRKVYPELDKPKRSTRVAQPSNRVVTNISKKNKPSLKDLPEDQIALAKEVLEACPTMTEEDYLTTYFREH